VVEFLPSKAEALDLIYSTDKKEGKKERQRKKYGFVFKERKKNIWFHIYIHCPDY
jgi:hypothetical protein